MGRVRSVRSPSRAPSGTVVGAPEGMLIRQGPQGSVLAGCRAGSQGPGMRLIIKASFSIVRREWRGEPVCPRRPLPAPVPQLLPVMFYQYPSSLKHLGGSWAPGAPVPFHGAWWLETQIWS